MNISMHGSEQGFFKYYSSFLIVWPVPISGCTYNVQKSLAKMGQRDMSLVLFQKNLTLGTRCLSPCPASPCPTCPSPAQAKKRRDSEPVPLSHATLVPHYGQMKVMRSLVLMSRVISRVACGKAFFMSSETALPWPAPISRPMRYGSLTTAGSCFARRR